MPKMVQFKALWDTGATNTCITKSLASQLGLQPTGKVKTKGVHGENEVSTYLVNVYLPNGVAFQVVRVTEGVIHNADVLIGMDIIRSGDFAVSNYQNRTIFSFRVPSVEDTDYQKEVGDFSRQNRSHSANQPRSKNERNRQKQQRRKNRGK